MPFKFVTKETKTNPMSPFFQFSDGWVERLNQFRAETKCLKAYSEFINSGNVRIRTSEWASEAEFNNFRNLDLLQEELQAWTNHNTRFGITCTEERSNS